jgi:type IV pilus assembly protein PilY1
MELTASSGARVVKPAIDVNMDGVIDEADVITYTDGSDSYSVPASGVKTNSLATSPVCITLADGTETCKSNTSDASIFEVTRDARRELGRRMWREL